MAGDADEAMDEVETEEGRTNQHYQYGAEESMGRSRWRKKGKGKTHLTEKKVFPMAPFDSLVECGRMVTGVVCSEMRGVQDVSYHFSLHSRITWGPRSIQQIMQHVPLSARRS